jgi:hypothetical protein
MKTIELKLYDFAELSMESKKRALEKYREFNTDYGWWESLLDDWKEKLAEQGFNDAEINFSGFGSQGDGASFTASVDLDKFLTGCKVKTKFKRVLDYDYDMVIKTSGNYSYVYSMDIDASYYDNDKLETMLLGELENLVLGEARDLAKEIYRVLEEEYYRQTSDEAVAETLETNEYDFTENGEIYF